MADGWLRAKRRGGAAATGAPDGPKEIEPVMLRIPFLLYGVLLFILGLLTYLVGVSLGVPRLLLGNPDVLLHLNELIVWYSGIPIVAGMGLAAIDLFVLIDRKRRLRPFRHAPLPDRRVTVALTAYNDEASIAEAVADFRSHPLVARVIVVSNNSRDRTEEVARAAGAITFNELSPGYGACVHRCLTEAARHEDTAMVVLCEGDRTFRAYDIDKLLAYAPHADVVNGTRTVEQLRELHTQLSTFMYYGNLFAGKLLEAKHLGASTITDLGTTYKLVHRETLLKLLPLLNPRINLEFNAYLLDRALGAGMSVVECPITFHPRVGESKGGNVSNRRALKVGMRMILGIVGNWRGERA